jgi:cyclohexadienyl dehydratase
VKVLQLHRRALIGAAMLLFLCGIVHAARFADAADDVARVYETIDARLALMSDVAAWKWSQQRPVVDEEREHAVLERILARAHELGLSIASVQHVLEVQIQMARAVQTEYFEQWRAEGFPTGRTIRALDTDLRPVLDALGEEQLAALYWARDEMSQAVVNESIAKTLRHIASYPGVTAQDMAELRSALHDLRADSRNIDTIAQLHVLRIGTTGDYAPFSSENSGELRGLDIELAQTLAAHLKLTPRFVRTSWPNLMNDLEADRFDLALSGIANTPERAARAEFSTAYHFDGKTPIARCEDRTRFGSLSEIDREPVRVIVNQGGTNQQFVRDHIEHAKVIVHTDNRTVFDEILAGRADVMITDALEVELQTRRHKELCRTMSGTLSNSAKAVLLPRGSALTKNVDQWLQAEVARGGMQQKLQRAMMSE